MWQSQLSYFNRWNRIRPFKLIKGKNGPTTFLPFNTKIGGQAGYIKDKEAICQTDNQARHVYKKVRVGKCNKFRCNKARIRAGTYITKR